MSSEASPIAQASPQAASLAPIASPPKIPSYYNAVSPGGINPNNTPVASGGIISHIIDKPRGDSQSSAVNTIADGAAVVGRWSAYSGAVGGVIIMIVLLIIGYTSLKDTHTASASMKITKVTGCGQQSTADGQGNVSVNYACTISVQFTTAAGKSYTAHGISVTSPSPLTTGSSITLRYNPSNPVDIKQEASPKTVGWAMIGIGVGVGVLSVGWAVVVSKSQGAAEASGAFEFMDAFHR